MSLTSDITTVLTPGMALRFRQPENHAQVNGILTGILRQGATPWLTVQRLRDGATVVVGLHEVVRVIAPAPTVLHIPEVRETGHVPRLEDKVRFVSPWGMEKVGWVREIDTVSALIEVGNPGSGSQRAGDLSRGVHPSHHGDLELIDLTDILAVLV